MFHYASIAKMQTDLLNKRIALFSIGMAFLAWMAVKLPMPALPALAVVFHTSDQVFQLSVRLNLIGFTISQIFWGPLSDRFGRRSILMIAFVFAIVGTVLAMLALNIYMYIGGRILEGFAVGSAAPIGRAIMADKLDKLTMVRVYAWYAIAALLPPAVGPIIGGYILVFMGWRYIFAFFLILALAYLIACYFWLPETLEKKTEKICIKTIFNSIKTIARTRYFWAYAITYALINGYMIAYYAAMPFWYVVHFHLGEDSYAWLAFLPIAGYIIGSTITSRLLHRFEMSSLLLAGIIVAIAVGVGTFFLTFISTPSIIILNVLMTLFSVASGIVTPMTNVSLMHQFRDKVTILSAMMSGLRVGGAGLLVLISTNINLNSYMPLAIYTLLVSFLGLGCYLALGRATLMDNSTL